MPAEIDIPVADGYACLPTLGRLRVGDARDQHHHRQRRRLRGPHGSRQVARAPGRPGAGLGLAAGAPTAVRARSPCSSRTPTRTGTATSGRPRTRLSAGDASRWQQRFAVAWPLIKRPFPATLPGLTAGLSALIPLANEEAGREISAASRQAFGAVGTALPVDGEALALLILHEFQHVKLGAVLDMFDLCDPAERRLFYAPWRDNPRPIGSCCRARTRTSAVTDYWRVRRHELEGAEALAAAERFARWRMLTAEAIETLAELRRADPARRPFRGGHARHRRALALTSRSRRRGRGRPRVGGRTPGAWERGAVTAVGFERKIYRRY